MPRASEFASYVFIKNDLSNLSWNTRNPNRNPDGQLYTQQECLDNPEIAAGLGRQKPEYVSKVKEDAFWVVEAKNTLDKIDVAYREAIDYAKDINKSDAVKAHIVTGVAGNDDDGYLVQTGVFTPAGKVEIVEYNNKPITGFLSPNQANYLVDNNTNILNELVTDESVLLNILLLYHHNKLHRSF